MHGIWPLRPCRWHRLHLCICLLCGSLLIAAATLLILCRQRSVQNSEEILCFSNAIYSIFLEGDFSSMLLNRVSPLQAHHFWDGSLRPASLNSRGTSVTRVRTCQNLATSHCGPGLHRSLCWIQRSPGKSWQFEESAEWSNVGQLFAWKGKATIKIVANHTSLNNLIQPATCNERHVKLHCRQAVLQPDAVYLVKLFFFGDAWNQAEQRPVSTAVAWRVHLRRIAMTRATYCQRRAEERHIHKDTQKLELFQKV